MLLTRRCIAAAAVITFLGMPAHADMSARWELHADFDDRRIPGALADCVFNQKGQRLSGTCEDATLMGEIQGEMVMWQLTPAGTHDIVTFTGMLDDDDTVVVGRFVYPRKGGGSFLAVRR
jgi:hypothetical protein